MTTDEVAATQLSDQPSRIAIDLEIVYTRTEYLGISLDCAEHELARRADAKGAPAPRFDKVSRAVLFLVGSLRFCVKRLRMPVNYFQIDGNGVTRTNRLGVVVSRWDDVVDVIYCREAYVLVTRKGGTPLPYRCFGVAERANMEQLLAVHRQQQHL